MIEISTLSKFASELEFQKIPQSVIRKMKISLVYNLSIALAGQQAARPALEFIFKLENKRYNDQTWIRSDELSLDHVAFANACIITARSQNETLYDALAHTGCVIIPCALVLSEKLRITGKELLTGLVAGYEATAAVAEGFAEATTKKGFRATALYSPFGASVTSAKILGLSQEQIETALAMVANFAAGVMQTWIDGTDEWLFQVGNSSKSGIISAMIAAESNIKGTTHALTGPAGFYRAHAHDVTFCPSNWLGESWKSENIQYKPFPGCALSQTAIHSAIQIKNKYQINPPQIKKITVWMNPDEHNYPGVQGHPPLSGRGSAVMSISFAMALCFLFGSVKNSDFDKFNDPQISGFMDKIFSQSSDTLPKQSCKIDVELINGQIYTELLHMSDNNIFLFDWARVTDFSLNLLPEMNISKNKLNEIIKIIDGLEYIVDISRLISLLSPAQV